MEPVTAIAGSLLSGVKKVEDDPKIRRALFLPAATVIGTELASVIDSWFQNARAKRLENLGAHIHRAQRVAGPDKIENIATDPAFMDWAEGVSKVLPNDQALSDVWQAALLAMQSGGITRLRILSVAQNMKPDEAVAFLGLGRFREPLPAAYRPIFEQYGLIKPLAERMGPLIPAGIVVFLLALSMNLWLVLFHAGMQVALVTQIIITISILLFPIIVVYSMNKVNKVVNTKDITRDGVSLLELVEEISRREAQKSPSKE